MSSGEEFLSERFFKRVFLFGRREFFFLGFLFFVCVARVFLLTQFLLSKDYHYFSLFYVFFFSWEEFPFAGGSLVGVFLCKMMFFNIDFVCLPERTRLRTAHITYKPPDSNLKKTLTCPVNPPPTATTGTREVSPDERNTCSRPVD